MIQRARQDQATGGGVESERGRRTGVQRCDRSVAADTQRLHWQRSTVDAVLACEAVALEFLMNSLVEGGAVAMVARHAMYERRADVTVFPPLLA